MREDDFIKEEEIDNSLLPTESSAPASGSLIKKGNEITNSIIREEDPSKFDELSQLFNLNQKKRQIVRANKMSNLLELVDDEVIARFTNHPDAIEDEDLLKYWKTTQESVSNHNEEDTQLPKITINNHTNVNINSSGLNRESRAKVLDVVNQILNGVNNGDIIDAEVKEKDR